MAEFRYRYAKGTPEAFKAAFDAQLHSKLGWEPTGVVSFRRTGEAPHAVIHLQDATEMETHWGKDVVAHITGPNMSFTDMTPNGPRDVVINRTRWQKGPNRAVGGIDLLSYQQYLTNHEIGHAMGLEHDHTARGGKLCPTMSQQTVKLAKGCDFNPRPTDSDVAALQNAAANNWYLKSPLSGGGHLMHGMRLQGEFIPHKDSGETHTSIRSVTAKPFIVAPPLQLTAGAKGDIGDVIVISDDEEVEDEEDEDDDDVIVLSDDEEVEDEDDGEFIVDDDEENTEEALAQVRAEMDRIRAESSAAAAAELSADRMAKEATEPVPSIASVLGAAPAVNVLQVKPATVNVFGGPVAAPSGPINTLQVRHKPKVDAIVRTKTICEAMIPLVEHIDHLPESAVKDLERGGVKAYTTDQINDELKRLVLAIVNVINTVGEAEEDENIADDNDVLEMITFLCHEIVGIRGLEETSLENLVGFMINEQLLRRAAEYVVFGGQVFENTVCEAIEVIFGNDAQERQNTIVELAAAMKDGVTEFAEAVQAKQSDVPVHILSDVLSDKCRTVAQNGQVNSYEGFLAMLKSKQKAWVDEVVETAVDLDAGEPDADKNDDGERMFKFTPETFNAAQKIVKKLDKYHLRHKTGSAFTPASQMLGKQAQKARWDEAKHWTPDGKVDHDAEALLVHNTKKSAKVVPSAVYDYVQIIQHPAELLNEIYESVDNTSSGDDEKKVLVYLQAQLDSVSTDTALAEAVSRAYHAAKEELKAEASEEEVDEDALRIQKYRKFVLEFFWGGEAMWASKVPDGLSPQNAKRIVLEVKEEVKNKERQLKFEAVVAKAGDDAANRVKLLLDVHNLFEGDVLEDFDVSGLDQRRDIDTDELVKEADNIDIGFLQHRDDVEQRKEEALVEAALRRTDTDTPLVFLRQDLASEKTKNAPMPLTDARKRKTVGRFAMPIGLAPDVDFSAVNARNMAASVFEVADRKVVKHSIEVPIPSDGGFADTAVMIGNRTVSWKGEKTPSVTVSYLLKTRDLEKVIDIVTLVMNLHEDDSTLLNLLDLDYVAYTHVPERDAGFVSLFFVPPEGKFSILPFGEYVWNKATTEREIKEDEEIDVSENATGDLNTDTFLKLLVQAGKALWNIATVAYHQQIGFSFGGLSFQDMFVLLKGGKATPILLTPNTIEPANTVPSTEDIMALFDDWVSATIHDDDMKDPEFLSKLTNQRAKLARALV